jgi:2-desacetyl-2-hydroxyethyl bacteriochlorophyllide A dehydrogenase
MVKWARPEAIANSGFWILDHMRTLTCISPLNLTFTDSAEPVSAVGKAIIRVRRVGICGTDLHGFEGTQPFFNYPRILGHELSGEVVDSGGSTLFRVGDVVTVIPYFSCGQCHACRNGKPNCCETISVYGVHEDGGMREYIQVPVESLLPGEGLDLDRLALTEPLAVAAHGIRRGGVKPGETVLIVGAGPIGIGLALFAGLAGARVLLSERHPGRMAFARKVVGADAFLDPAEVDIKLQLADLTNGAMPDAIFDATGSLKAMEASFPLMSHGGRFILVGLQREEIRFSHPEFHKREATLMSSRNATRDDFNFVLESIRSGRIDPLRMVTDRVDFEEVPYAFPKWLDPGHGTVKALACL